MGKWLGLSAVKTRAAHLPCATRKKYPGGFPAKACCLLARISDRGNIFLV